MTTKRMTVLPQPIFSPRPAPVLLDKAQSAAETLKIFTKRPPMALNSPIPVPAVTPDPVIPDTPDLPDVLSLTRLMQGGRWRTEAMRAYGRPVLYWFTRGAGRATIGGTTRGFAPHTAFLVPPGIMHGFDLIGQVSGSVVFLPKSMAAA